MRLHPIDGRDDFRRNSGAKTIRGVLFRSDDPASELLSLLLSYQQVDGAAAAGVGNYKWGRTGPSAGAFKGSPQFLRSACPDKSGPPSPGANIPFIHSLIHSFIRFLQSLVPSLIIPRPFAD